MQALIPRLLAVAVLPCCVQLHAAPLDAALEESQQLAAEAKASQARIEQLDDATRQMLTEYRNAVQQAEALKAYNEQLVELTAAQRKELDGFQRQLDSIERTQEAVAPQMGRMIEVLEEFIAADLPFLPDERADRLASLQDMQPRADVSLAEKYRRILEAYQIESDYGRTLESWRGTLGEGEQVRVVNFLRLGRVMLFYQSLDGREQGYWNTASASWEPLGDSYRRTLEQGLSIARQQQTPVMLRLPLPPVAEQEAGL